MFNTTHSFIEDTHHQVVENHMDIFCDLHTVDGDMQTDVRQLVQLSAVIPGQADDFAARFFGILYSVQHIF